METNKEKEVKKNIADLAEDASLGRDKATDENQEGYNFMGTLHSWTTEDEQERKVREIEKVTNEQELQVKAIADGYKRERGTKKS